LQNTKVEIYQEIKGPQNAQVKAIQAAARKLAGRFPALNLAPLKQCPASQPHAAPRAPRQRRSGDCPCMRR